MINIYGQEAHHDMVRIVGTADDLKYLAASINFSIMSEDGVAMWSTFDSNGEGYDVEITVVDRCVFNELESPYGTGEKSTDRYLQLIDMLTEFQDAVLDDGNIGIEPVEEAAKKIMNVLGGGSDGG